MLRTVADETPSPAALTSSDEATGSPDEMYSRTSAASTRFDRSTGGVVGPVMVISTRSLRVLTDYNTVAQPFRAASARTEPGVEGRRLADRNRDIMRVCACSPGSSPIAW